MRPFGISTLLAGFELGVDGAQLPRLYQTDPSGIFSLWKASAIGRSSKTVREFLEKHYVADMSKDDSIKLAIKALLEIVQTGAKNIEIAVMTADGLMQTLSLEQIEAVIAELDKEKADEAEKKSKKPSASQA